MADVKSKEGVENVVRVLGYDLDGNKKIYHALIGVKGISHNFAKAILRVLNIDESRILKDFSEEEIKNIEECAKNPLKYGIPSWMLNRRKDYESGKDIHLVGSDIDLTLKNDINRLRKIRAYRGIRHELGLPVRGQRTKTSFRHRRIVTAQKRKR